jgi:tetratricopeptide (TPR) repeat protein
VDAAAGRKPPGPSRRKKALFAVIACVGFFAALEGILYGVGVRPLAHDEDPFAGFESWLPLFVERAGPDGDRLMVTAENKLRFFNRQEFSREKARGVFRVFCMGGSTTYGRPYDDATSFCGWLRELLPEVDPRRSWEVVNAGGISYATYRVAALMAELAAYDPDLFIVYTGHNEFLERRTYADLLATPAPVRKLNALLGRTRTYSLMHRAFRDRPSSREARELLPAEVHAILDESVGPEDYRRDPELQRKVVEHYRQNVARMVDLARGAGAEILFVDPASNLRDCSPFKSEPRPGLGLAERERWQRSFDAATALHRQERFEEALAGTAEALALDDQYAHLHYLRGQLLDAVGRYDEAETAYRLAVDHDICPLRALSSIHRALEETATSHRVPLVDFAGLVRDRSPQHIPGKELFLDHIHPTIRGHGLLASALVDAMGELGRVDLGPAWGEEIVERVGRRIEGRIDRRAHGLALRNLAQVMSWAGKLNEAYRTAKRALALIPDDGETHFLVASTAQKLGEDAEASEHYAWLIANEADGAASLYYVARARYNYALHLVREGRIDDGIALLEESVAIGAGPPRADEKLAELLAARGAELHRAGRADEAAARFGRLVELRPQDVDARNRLAAVLIHSDHAEQAADQLEAAIRIDPRHAPSRANLGVALIHLGRVDEAERELRLALELDPSHAQARRNLERLRHQRGTTSP